MNISVIITTTVTGLFLLAAFIWSLSRIRHGRALWRVIHALIAVLMVAGVLAVAFNNLPYGVMAGVPLLLLSLAALMFDKSRLRWLAFIQVFSGLLLAGGVPFVSG